MAPDSPPQPVLAGCSLRAQLFSLSDNGRFEFLSEMQGLTGDGAVILAEEPVSPATSQPGDLLISFVYEGKIRMGFISKIEVGGGSDQDEESSSDSDAEHENQDEESSSDSDAQHNKDTSETEEVGSTGSDVKGEDGGDGGSFDTDGEEEESDQSLTSGSSSRPVTEAEDKESSDTDEGVKERNLLLQIKLWSQYCVLVLFEDGCWKLTKQQPIQWLKEDQMEEVQQKIITENERNELNIRNPDLLDLSKQICLLGFRGPLEHSEAVEKFINSDLNPSIKNYKMEKLLGSGATCDVYGVGTKYAIKMMELNKKFDDTDALEGKEPREITILSSFRDSAVVSFFQAWAADGIYKTYLKGSSGEDTGRSFDDDDSDSDDDLEDVERRYIVIQMECCGRTLGDLLREKKGKIDVEEAWLLFKEITKGVQAIHRSGVIHRDLKPLNLFFGYAATNTIKIGDFGHARWAKPYAAHEGGTPERGTPGYSAPELHGEKPTSPTYKADMYSLGIILLDLFYPFKSGHERSKVVTLFKTDQYPSPADWNGDATLLKKLVASSPSDRSSADEILEYISNRI